MVKELNSIKKILVSSKTYKTLKYIYNYKKKNSISYKKIKFPL